MEKDNANQGAAAPHSLTLVIDRAKWLRGQDKGMLLRSADGKMCCLGFFGIACGIPADALADKGMPDEAAPESWPEWMLKWDNEDESDYRCTTYDCDSLASANDSRDLTEKARETEIAELFAQHGVAVEFVGDAASAAPKEAQP